VTTRRLKYLARLPRIIAAVALVSIAAGCGDDSSSPTPAPTPVIPNVQGQWTGEYQIASCNNTGVFATSPPFCNTFNVGSVWPVRLTLTQTGTQLSGTLELGAATMQVSGPIGSSGQLLLTGTGSIVQGGVTFNVSLANWNTTVAGTSMSGGWGINWTTTFGTGNAATSNTIRTVTKTG